MRHFILFAQRALLAAVCLVVAPAVAEDQPADKTQVVQVAPSDQQLTDWVHDLDARKFAIREQATDSLVTAGAPAVPYLAKALHGPSLEASHRAVWVLQQLAETGEQPVQLAALELLVTSKRFPAVVRTAELELAELYEEICRTSFEKLGGEFTVSSEARTPYDIGAQVELNTNCESWTGTRQDVLQLCKLRHVAVLRIASRLVDDEIAKCLAKIDGLEVLELIETKATLQVVAQLKEQHPELRVRLKSRAALGIVLLDGGAPTVSSVQRDTPAEKAGFKADDVILSLGGHKVATFDELTTRIAQYDPGDTVTIRVLREEEELDLTATLVEANWLNEKPLGDR
ncbi:S1C family serine protease [Aeoliella sp.]|uniref:S1C family serine protease n=1 Tax=Aeoliella sp. TaxID=2795800 RepID=UPI003CCB8FD7